MNWIAEQVWRCMVAAGSGWLCGLWYMLYAAFGKRCRLAKVRQAVADMLFMAVAVVLFAALWLLATEGALRLFDFVCFFFGVVLFACSRQRWTVRRDAKIIQKRSSGERKPARHPSMKKRDKRQAEMCKPALPKKEKPQRKPGFAERSAYRMVMWGSAMLQHRRARRQQREALLSVAENNAQAEIKEEKK